MDTLFPYTTLCRSPAAGSRKDFEIAREGAVGIDRPHSAPLLHEQLRAFHKARHLRRHISKVGLAIAEEVHPLRLGQAPDDRRAIRNRGRSEEHTSELQSLMRISYAVFCMKKK